MRKTAGFLIVLLLATLVVITTSSGDETDSSHVVHLTATYGPQIAACADCHPASYVGVFTDGQDLANTTVCDTCHSPSGAYDGVDDTNIGAKNNWAYGASSLVFSGGDFLPGKEKWCVGCHDDVPSLINGVSAPNIAGDDIDYGYYKTGHGKYVSESITCLACHDPDSEHVVDGVARTYSAAADNYQAGYRLKLMDGLAPLVIPRPLTPVTADQFRQCFSCHDSAPFMNFDNTDTNFRADVDDSCVALGPPANRHWDHLSITEDKYDSDFDGVSADSPPSCPACHNVHGPRLSVGAGITNAPGMIRTGELIGREIEGALDLDYFINPCPDTTLSPTNETVGSTGGMMIEYSPTGNGSIPRNGVCDMCHTEAQPYWRVAKTLPVQAGNDFSGDGNAVALWSVDNGALITDSIRTNTLTDNNTVGTDTVDYIEGNASADFESSNSEFLSITDANLDSGFPFKSGGSGTFSVAFWYKAESQGAFRGLVSKWDTGAGARSLLFRDNNGQLEFFIGTNSGAGSELLDNSLSTSAGVWYHVGATFNNTTKAWTLRVYEDGVGVVVNASGTATNNISITAAPFAIGTWFNNGTPQYPIDGLMDEIVVFNDILTTAEIDQIRQGTYAEVTPPTTTTTTLFPPTTTTTLPPTTTTTTLFPPTTTTTLPPGQNDFSGDVNAAALWSVDNGALTTDSIGTNTLTDNNTVGTDTTNFKEGDASADFESNNSEYLSITDANLNSGFPLKSGESNGDFSVTFWYKLESLNNFAALVSKWDTGSGARSFMIRDHNGTLDFYIGYTSGTSYELLDNSLSTSTGRWYHVGATFNNTTKAWQLRVWDDTAGNVVLNASGTATNNISITSAPFGIGATHNSGTPERFVDGLMDEIVVLRDILTTGEIDQIRSGTYSGPAPTTTTLFPPTTTTTTLPPVPGDNDFSGDGNAEALWRVDNGTLTTDSIGTNTLTDNNTVGTDTVDYQEGQASASFEISNSESLTITDANLASGFPLKSGESNGDISVTFWFKFESLNNFASLISKWDSGAGARSFMIRDHNGTLDFYIGYNSGASYELLTNALTTVTGVWYHVGATFNNTTKAWTLRVYEDGVGVVVNASGTATNNISITDAPFAIGASHNSGTPERFIDGLMDEIVVFSDILTTAEIDQIRQGTYAEVTPPTTTTTTLFPPTTTTTTLPSTTTCADIPDKGTCQNDPNCEWVGSPKSGTCQDIPAAEICDSGIDEDGDGLVDCDDPDCAGVGSCPALPCADIPDRGTCNEAPDCEWIGSKNNGTCEDATVCVPDETPEATCTDGVDNDCDGMTDCADTADCSGDPACQGGSCDTYTDKTSCQSNGCTWSNKDKVCM